MAQEFECRVKGYKLDNYKTMELTLIITNPNSVEAFVLLEQATKLKDSKKTISGVVVAFKKPKRSLNANAYFHVLVDAIAKATRLANNEVKTNLVLD